MSDEGFHEIQLNGKQLVFLFMASTVVAVVIFLCGVMVGRGVRAERGEAIAQAADPTAAAPASTPPPSAAAPGTPSTEPPVPAEDDYYKSLTNEKPTDGTLKAPAPKAAEKPANKPVEPAKAPAPPAATPTPAPKTANAKPAAAPVADANAPAAVTSGGFAVQITALRDRGEADAIVKRLAAKGYPAYILNPLPGKPPVYRVQVGRYQNRGDADRIASRLQKEEQYSPWVTR
jgi:DedD protein